MPKNLMRNRLSDAGNCFRSIDPRSVTVWAEGLCLTEVCISSDPVTQRAGGNSFSDTQTPLNQQTLDHEMSVQEGGGQLASLRSTIYGIVFTAPWQPGSHYYGSAVAMRDVSRLKRQHVGSECGLAVAYVASHQCHPQRGFASFSHSLESGTEGAGKCKCCPQGPIMTAVDAGSTR